MLKSLLTQTFPQPPTFLPSSLPPSSLSSKTILITGSTRGIGHSLAKSLTHTSAKIYITGRTLSSINAAIKKLKNTYQQEDKGEEEVTTTATYIPLLLDLADLTSIRTAASTFLSQEQRLDILFHNAGIAIAEKGSTTTQGIEMHIGVNCIGPFLLTQLLLPILQQTAKSGADVRVIWSASLVAETDGPNAGELVTELEKMKNGTSRPRAEYAVSKLVTIFLANEMAQRHGANGIISVAANPGNCDTDMYTALPSLGRKMTRWMLYSADMGACTLLYAGFGGWVGDTQEEMGMENGGYIWPFGRRAGWMRRDWREALEKGEGARVWEWCESFCRGYF